MEVVEGTVEASDRVTEAAERAIERTTEAGLTATAVSGGASEPTEASKTATASKPNGLATEAILFGSLYEDGEDENNILDEVDHSQVSHSQERGLRVQV